MTKKKSVFSLVGWYLDLPEIRQLDSYADRIATLARLIEMIGSKKDAGTIRSVDIMNLQKNLVIKGYKPASVNKKISYLIHCFKKADAYGYLNSAPKIEITRLKENNTRDRMLSKEEFSRLLNACHPLIKDIVLTGYWLPMRKMELIRLVWNDVKLDGGYIRVGWDNTKKKYSRLVPIHPTVSSMMSKKRDKIGIVFKYRDNNRQIPKTYLHEKFSQAVQSIGLGDFVFHDLRHCAANNLRLAGNPLHVIMKAGGWKSVKALERYLLVSEDEMKNVKFL